MSTKRQKMERSSSDDHKNNQDNQEDDERKPAARAFLWVKVPVDGQQTSIVVKAGDSIDTIKEAIKEKRSNAFALIDASDLELFESLEDMKQGKDSMDATIEWNPNVTWGTKTQPLIVQVPVRRVNVTPWSHTNALEKAIAKHFSTPVTTFQDNETHLYKIDGDNLVMGQQAWIKDLPDRFADGLKKGILYRPEIVTEIIAKINENLSEPVAQGLMIKGPQGIGKSHSIVNVIRKLQSTGNYLVTYIPNCEKWDDIDYLIEAICSSFGSKYENLDLQYFKEKNYEEDPNFINEREEAMGICV